MSLPIDQMNVLLRLPLSDDQRLKLFKQLTGEEPTEPMEPTAEGEEEKKGGEDEGKSVPNS